MPQQSLIPAPPSRGGRTPWRWRAAACAEHTPACGASHVLPHRAAEPFRSNKGARAEHRRLVQAQPQGPGGGRRREPQPTPSAPGGQGAGGLASEKPLTGRVLTCTPECPTIPAPLTGLGREGTTDTPAPEYEAHTSTTKATIPSTLCPFTNPLLGSGDSTGSGLNSHGFKSCQRLMVARPPPHFFNSLSPSFVLVTRREEHLPCRAIVTFPGKEGCAISGRALSGEPKCLSPRRPLPATPAPSHPSPSPTCPYISWFPVSLPLLLLFLPTAWLPLTFPMSTPILQIRLPSPVFPFVSISLSPYRRLCSLIRSQNP